MKFMNEKLINSYVEIGGVGRNLERWQPYFLMKTIVDKYI